MYVGTYYLGVLFVNHAAPPVTFSALHTKTMINFDRFFAAIEREAALKRLHHDRRMLQTIPFTAQQLTTYDDRVTGINDRLTAYLNRKSK